MVSPEQRQHLDSLRLQPSEAVGCFQVPALPDICDLLAHGGSWSVRLHPLLGQWGRSHAPSRPRGPAGEPITLWSCCLCTRPPLAGGKEAGRRLPRPPAARSKSSRRPLAAKQHRQAGHRRSTAAPFRSNKTLWLHRKCALEGFRSFLTARTVWKLCWFGVTTRSSVL